MSKKSEFALSHSIGISHSRILCILRSTSSGMTPHEKNESASTKTIKTAMTRTETTHQKRVDAFAALS